ncbi:MAG: hypothetical protein U0T74_07565 [Chitinophagales bacterium]
MKHSKCISKDNKELLTDSNKSLTDSNKSLPDTNKSLTDSKELLKDSKKNLPEALTGRAESHLVPLQAWLIGKNETPEPAKGEPVRRESSFNEQPDPTEASEWGCAFKTCLV